MFLLLLTFIAFGVLPADDPCEERFAGIQASIDSLGSWQPDEVQAFLGRIRAAQACAEDKASTSYHKLLRQEMYVLLHLDAYQEVLVASESLHVRLVETVPLNTDDSISVAWVYSTRANAHYHLGHLQSAAGAYAKAIDFEPHSDKRAKYSLDFGNTLHRMQDVPAALNAYTNARSQLEAVTARSTEWKTLYSRALYGNADALLSMVGEDTTSIAAFHVISSDEAAPMLSPLDVAVQLLQEVLALSEDDIDRTVQALLELGEAYAFMGQFAKAEQHILEAKVAAENAVDPHWRFQVRLILGRFYLRVGDLEEAEAALLESYARMDDARHDDYKRLLLLFIGVLYENKHDFQEAAAYYQRAIDVTDSYYASLRSTDWAARTSNARQLPRRGLIRMLLAQQRFEEAFLTLEESRAGHLQDLRIQARLLGDLSVQDRQQFDSLGAALSATLDALATDTLDAHQKLALKAEQAKLSEGQRRLLKLDKPMAATSVDALRRRLQPDQVLLSYFITEEDVEGVPLLSNPASYVFVLDADSLRAVHLPTSAPDLVERLRQVSSALSDGQDTTDVESRFFSLDALSDLYTLIYAPVSSAIPPESRLVVVPDGPLFLLPFGMLVEETSSDHDFRQARYLMHRHPVSVELAAVLVDTDASAPATFAYDLIAFGKSDFSDIDQTRRASSLSLRGASWDSLPAIEEEIARIQSLFQQAVFRMNEEAEESSFRTMASQAQIVHLASHTLLNGNAPLQNAVILSLSSDGHDDGFLFLHEIQRLQLATHLVVLSGCNTARGVLRPGEGLAGLQYAFRASGVPSTLATSWFVDDDASAVLMESFYRHLLEGLPKDVALQQAQIDYLDTASPHTSSPFFWAAPVLYGNTVAMPLEGASLPWTLLLLLPVVLALLYLGRQAFARYRA